MATAEEQAKADKAAADKVEADQKAAAAELLAIPVEVTGGPGAAAIYGRGFGDSGSLVIGGHVVTVSQWKPTVVKFTLPEGVKGDVALTTPSGVRRGVYPTPPKAAAPPVKVEVTMVDGKPTSATATTGGAPTPVAPTK